MITMYRLLALSGLFFAATLGNQARADDPHYPHPIDLLPEHTFAPPGFDDNDNAQVILEGRYISSCFRNGVPEATVDYAKHQIYVRTRTLYYQSSWCVRVFVPYTVEVNLGVLPAGVYGVNVMDTQGQWHPAARLPIAAARSPSPDDFLYAPVTDASIEDGDVLHLRGRYTNDCMSIDDATLLYRAQNIIEVLPKMKLAQRGCRDVMVPFETTVKLNSPYRGKTLIYIRTMNGQAVNRLADF
jgi:hypothetical protein